MTPPELMSIRGDMKMLFKFYKWGRDLEVICDLMLVSHQIGKPTKYVVVLPSSAKSGSAPSFQMIKTRRLQATQSAGENWGYEFHTMGHDYSHTELQRVTLSLHDVQLPPT